MDKPYKVGQEVPVRSGSHVREAVVTYVGLLSGVEVVIAKGDSLADKRYYSSNCEVIFRLDTGMSCGLCESAGYVWGGPERHFPVDGLEGPWKLEANNGGRHL